MAQFSRVRTKPASLLLACFFFLSLVSRTARRLKRRDSIIGCYMRQVLYGLYTRGYWTLKPYGIVVHFMSKPGSPWCTSPWCTSRRWLIDSFKVRVLWSLMNIHEFNSVSFFSQRSLLYLYCMIINSIATKMHEWEKRASKPQVYRLFFASIYKSSKYFQQVSICS